MDATTARTSGRGDDGTAGAGRGARPLALIAVVVLGCVWAGLLMGISFIEAPLKFLAPGITIPLGLGIGRLVFTALNVVGAVLLLALTVARLRAGIGRFSAWTFGSLWAVFLAEVLVVRPQLNARTDLVLAGAEAGRSPWHHVYIAADLVVLALIAAVVLRAARELRALVPTR